MPSGTDRGPSCMFHVSRHACTRNAYLHTVNKKCPKTGCVVPLQIFHPVTSYVWHMYEVLNVDEKITNYTDYDKFTRRIY
jgi:hypothetical protein